MLRKFYPLKVRSIDIDGQQPTPVKWGNLLSTLLQFTKDGFSPDTMRKTIKIMDKLDAAYQTEDDKKSMENNESRYILFDEEEWSLIKGKFTEGFKFNLAHKTLLEFVDDIEKMPEDTTGNKTFVGDDE